MKYPFLDLKAANELDMPLLEEAARRVIQSGRYVGGEENEAFERELAAVSETPFAVGVSNGLDALRLILRSYIELGRMAPGDEVIVPANTYIASVLAVSDSHLIPVFCEPDPRTMNLDTSLLERCLTPRTRAVMTVHLYGLPCYDSLLAGFVRDHDLLLIEDNAQAIGATAIIPSPKGTTTTGSLGHAAAFSFYPTKNIGALGDAGAVTTFDSELATAVRSLSNYGSDRRYHNIYKGFNCRLDPIQAAFLRIKLAGLKAESERRRALAGIYQSEITNPAVKLPLPERGAVWHQYVVRVEERDRFRTFLADNGVGTDIHYAVPPHRQPCYKEYSLLNLPVTDALAATVVSLPIGRGTSASDAKEIASIINSFH